MSVTQQSVEEEIQAKGKTAPRVTPDDVEAEISGEYFFTAADATRGAPQMEPLALLTFCVLVLRNGFTVTGESACASPENFDAEIGQRIARKNAVDKIWPLLGYQLRSQLHTAASLPPASGSPLFRKKQLQEMEPWTPDIDMSRVSVSPADAENGSPKVGDMIATNPSNVDDKWLVAEKFFKDNYEPA